MADTADFKTMYAMLKVHSANQAKEIERLQERLANPPADAALADDALCESLIESSDMRWNGDVYIGDGADLMNLVRAALRARSAPTHNLTEQDTADIARVLCWLKHGDTPPAAEIERIVHRNAELRGIVDDLRARAVPGVPLSALVCVGRARFPRTGGNAGIAWHVEDALSDTGGFRSGSPCNGELLFVLPTTAKRAMLAASQPHATAVPEGMAKLEDKDAQWWLADVDQHGTGWIIDGPHKDRVGADRAFHLHVALGLRPKCRFGVARVTLFEPRENSEGVNREAIALLAASKSGEGKV